MGKIKRKDFLKMSALAALSPFAGSFLSKAETGRFRNFSKNDLLTRLVVANDAQVIEILKALDFDAKNFSRRIGHEFASLSAAFVSPGSKYYQDAQLVSALDSYVDFLLKNQSADGTVNIGNLESPPDTAFLIESLTAGTGLLLKDKNTALDPVKSKIRAFIEKTGQALVVGGVHTPNHRWVMCAAMARIHSLYPNPAYPARIEDWLGEGVYNDADGQYPERSRIYSNVEDTAFLTIGRLLNKPALYEPVRKNLTATWYMMDPNGDLVTTNSRRQDQYMDKTIVSYYPHYRYLAIHDNNGLFAGITATIESMEGFEKEIINNSLAYFLENPELLQDLPAETAPPDNYEKLFALSSLLRIRRKNITATLFGGTDQPIIIASGRSNSPNFFAYRKGKAILKYMRLSTYFFSTGYFYSEGLKKNGSSYTLHKKLDVPYYQPLPKNLRNSKGDYTLSPSIDDRFWNKMDFKNRKVSNVKTLNTVVSLEEKNGVCELTFDINGQPGVPVTLELCFGENGSLTGVQNGEEGNSFLETGMGVYECEGDTISFGPGAVTHKIIKSLEGERYSTHFGSLRTKGLHVYLTGTTPFHHKISFS